jgi:thioredoxin 2
MAALVTCPNCGKRNRVAPGAAGVPRCGNCHELLPWLVEAEDGSFEAELKTSLPVLIDLWAPWCGPCKWVSPAIEEIATTHRGQVKVIKVNVDGAPRVAARFEVSGIPTLVVMRDGEEVDRIAGAPSKPDLVSWLERHLAERVG